MKPLARRIETVASLAVAIGALAGASGTFAQSAQPPDFRPPDFQPPAFRPPDSRPTTRADVRADLIEWRAAGFDPLDWIDYPDNALRASRIVAERRAQRASMRSTD